MPDYLLGIDLGTSSLKALLIDAQGKQIASASATYALHTPQPGWAEQEPMDWIQACRVAVRQTLAQSNIDPHKITGIGLSGQMHGLVCVGKNGQPLRPAIIWADQRSAPQMQAISRKFPPPQLAAWTGTPIATGFQLPSWLWLNAHEPQICRASHKLLLPKDFLRFWLTGQYGSDPSDASGTGLFDPYHSRWCSPLLEEVRLDPSLLPLIGESATLAGCLQNEPAAALGLPAGLSIAMGGSDQACQAFGRGLIDPGETSLTIGTGGQIFTPLSSPAADPLLRLHLFRHVLPGRWHLEAATLSAGLSLRWLQEQFFPALSFAELSILASQAPPASEGLIFLPYLAGERTPHMDPTARGSWVGLTSRHGAAHLVRSVMEGVAFSLRQCLSLVESLSAPSKRLILSGGVTNSPVWMQILASVLQRPLQVSRQKNPAALGAALLAGLAAQVYPDATTAIRKSVSRTCQIVFPEGQTENMYGCAYAQFLKIYPAIKPIGLVQ